MGHRISLFRQCLFLALPVLMMTTDARAEVLETLIVKGDRGGETEPPPVGYADFATEDRQVGMRIDTAELLQGLPGVQADSRSNYAQDTRLTMRGFGARSAFGVRGIDLRLDGVPLSMPDGQGQLSSILIDEVESVQVLRGPLAALYGNGAGGVVSFETRAPDRDRVQASARLGEGDRHNQSLTAEWQQDAYAARVQGARFKTEGERPHAQAERRRGGAQFYYTGDSGLEASVRFDMSHDPLLQDPLGLTPSQWEADAQAGNPRAETFNTRKQLRHRQMSGRLRQTEGEQRWELAAWRGQREVNQWLPFAGDDIGSSGAVIDLTKDFSGMRGNLSRDWAFWETPATVSVGVTLAEMTDRRRGYVNEQGQTGDLRRHERGQVKSRDLHTLLEWRPAEKWELTGGVRYGRQDFTVDDYFIVPPEGDRPGNPDDSGERHYENWSMALGASWRLSRRWEMYGGSGRGFETPTLTEMAYRNQGTGLNTQLEPARNNQHELGVRLGSGDQKLLDMSVFFIDSRDELVVDRSEGGRTTYRNAAATERFGLELSGDLRFGRGWQALYSASYLDAEYTQGPWDGNRLPGIADTNLYLQMRWTPWDNDWLSLAAVGRYRGEVATADDNRQQAPSAALADLSVRSSPSFGRWHLDAWLKLANLADEKYVGSVIVNQGSGRSFEPAPGRHVSAGLTVDYQW